MPRQDSCNTATIHRLKDVGDYTFAGEQGLELRITKAGTRTWRWCGRVKTNAAGQSPKCSISLGHLKTAVKGRPCNDDLKRIRSLAKTCAEQAARGIDPKAAKLEAVRAENAAEALRLKEQGEALTVSDLWDYYRQPNGALSTLSERAPAEAESIWRIHLQEPFGSTVAATITAQDVKTFYRDIEKRGRSADKHLALLSNIMREGMERGVFASNPCAGASKAVRGHKAKKDTVKSAIPTQGELGRILELAYEKRRLYGLLVDFAASTGLRQMPTLVCRWEWLRGPESDRSATITVPKEFMKSGREHVLPLTERLWGNLSQWRTRGNVERLNGYVFPSPNDPSGGKPIGKPRRWWRDILTEVGLPSANWHSLRKYAATEMARNGVPVHVARQVLDHADISTTMLYFDEADDSDLIKAMNAVGSTISNTPQEKAAPTVVPLHAKPAT
ncbi:integrase [Algimonas arctica]|uniref:Integrase n=1 Tax=Algimonas arctica TaxID=1479486 RepID=A0A8J3CTD4_9PROT|nr:tyrosine-type recombinase/integrase [Algimonas arctica]GHA98640.1 integrase [Algimonas arctica]